MNDKPTSPLEQRIGEKSARKIRARKHAERTVWFGLGMMGLIGWSVAVPTVLGAALGIWLDVNHPGGRSWTLALLVAGLVLGCLIALNWVVKELKEMQKEQEEDGDE